MLNLKKILQSLQRRYNLGLINKETFVSRSILILKLTAERIRGLKLRGNLCTLVHTSVSCVETNRNSRQRNRLAEYTTPHTRNLIINKCEGVACAISVHATRPLRCIGNTEALMQLCSSHA